MTNNLVLPLLALILAVAAALFPMSKGDAPGSADRLATRNGGIVCAIVLLLFTGATLMWPSTFAFGSAISLALGLGMLMALFSASATPSRWAVPLGKAVLGGSLVHLVPIEALHQAQLGLVVGVFVGAISSSYGRSRREGYACAALSLFVIAADFLGREAVGSEPAGNAGIALGLVALAAAVVSGAFTQKASAFARQGVLFLLILLAGSLVCWKYLDDVQLVGLWMGGVVLAAAVNWLLAGEEQPEAFRFAVATVLWVAGATIAFSLKLGFGMSVGLVGGAATLALLGSVRGLASMAVAASILVYRLFRESHPEGAKALDIGQHYTMVGICIGALMPLLPIEWARGATVKGWRDPVSHLLWLAILAAIPAAAAVMLGSKGVIGLVVGFSFAAVVEGFRGASTLAPLGITAGLGTFTALSYAWLLPWMDLARDEKQKALLILSIAVAAVAAALYAISREHKAATP